MTARCELTELLVDQCAHCRQLDLPAECSGSFRAQYMGGCPACDGPIAIGELIRPVDGRYVHTGCAP